MKHFQKINTTQWEVNKVQDNVAQVLDDVTKKDVLDTILIQGEVLLAGQDNYIKHNLNRPIKMWVLARQNNNSTVWEVTSPSPSNILNLRCSINCKVSILVG